MKEPIQDDKNHITFLNNIKRYIKSAFSLPWLYDTLYDQQELIIKMDSQLTNLKTSIDKNDSAHIEIKPTRNQTYFASNHLLDKFYLNFENEFRGSPELIAERLLEYIPLFINLPKSKTVIDVGCGRGEFLEILKDNKINAMGVDLNESMIKECEDKGLKVVKYDAIEYLSSAKDNQFEAITAIHFVEHIHFDDLLVFINECYRTLDDTGFVLFETPNPSNLSVGSHTFYLDPSHLRPIPPSLLAFAMKTVGFKDVEIRLLHPENEFESDKKLETELYRRVFGARDYAVIAKK